MKRGCTIGSLSKGSKILIGVMVVGAAAVGGYVIYKRSQQPGMSTIQPDAIQQGAPETADLNMVWLRPQNITNYGGNVGLGR